jgi:predicted regulator of Ras-like GTPase activity (Roadblock/LC7/MglB family)
MPTSSVLERDAVGGNDALDHLLGAFLGVVPDASGVVIASESGKPIASKLPAERIQLIAASAMANLLAWAGEAVAANLRLPGMLAVTLDGPSWKVIVAPTPSHAGAVLVLLADSADPTRVHTALPSFLRAVDRSLEAAGMGPRSRNPA